MQLVALHGVDLTSLRDFVDDGSYARGVRYAEQHAVVRMHWMSQGDFYESMA